MEKLYNKIFNEKTASNSIIIGFIISLIMLLFFIFKGSYELVLKDDISEEKIGQFGDFIGGVIGTLFSLVGVILFYIALKEQRADFKTNQEALNMQLNAFEQQIKEFELQREELTETRKIFEQQTKTMKSQQFESNFYSLLNVFITIQGNYIGKNLFSSVLDEIRNKLSKAKDHSSFCQNVNQEYLNAYLAHRADLAKYFMTLYRLFKVIEECQHFNDSEKRYYHKIVRSQINKDELLLLYYNYHSDFGKKPIPISLKYEYFKHLETFSKFEFEVTFNFGTREIIHFNKVLDKVINLVLVNLDKAKQLTENDIKEEIEIFPNIYLGIYIEDNIDIKLVIKNNETKIDNIELPIYKEVVKYILIDILYSRSFKSFDENNLQESTTTSQGQLEYNFKFKTSNE